MYHYYGKFNIITMQCFNDWITKDANTADFGDKRLNKRFIDLLGSLSQTPDYSIPSSCKTWKETIAAYRFFNHEHVNPTNILSSHKESTIERIKEEKLVLILQDTTEINFSGRKPISGMGYLGTEKSHGFYIHPSLATTSVGLCLGVTDFQNWARHKLGYKE